MAHRSRNKIPSDPRYKRFNRSYSNNALVPSSSPPSADIPPPPRRNSSRSQRPMPPPPPPATAEKPKSERKETESLEGAPPLKSKKKLSKQLSMCETARDIAWEKRRRQIIRQGKRRNSIAVMSPQSPSSEPSQSAAECDALTDADLHELKGSIELGFGFNEEEGQKLCSTLPALDLYFAVNRQLSPSPVSTPRSKMQSMSPIQSPKTTKSDDSWRICGPGDDPQQVKTKLRHWAQAVACSIIQSS